MHRPLIVIPCVMGLLFTAGLGTPEGGFAHAQTTATMGASPVTMEQVIDFAKSHYPAIKAARAEQRAAQAAVGVAKTDYLPRTDLLWQTNRATANNIYGLLLPQNVVPNISGPVIASDTTRSAWSSGGGALLSWQPFDFGVRSAKVDAAREGSQAAEHAASLTTLEVSTAAASAFLDLAAAQQLVTAALSNVRRIEAFDKALHVLVENQLRPGADATQADAQLALARNQLIQAQTQEAVRQSVLAAYLERQGEQVAIDASQLLTAIPVSDLERAEARVHPFVIEEGALAMQLEARCQAAAPGQVLPANFRGGLLVWRLTRSTGLQAFRLHSRASITSAFANKRRFRAPTFRLNMRATVSRSPMSRRPSNKLAQPLPVPDKLQPTRRWNSPRPKPANSSNKFVIAPGWPQWSM